MRIFGRKTSGSSIRKTIAAALLAATGWATPLVAQNAPAPSAAGGGAIVEGRVVRPSLTGEVPVPDLVVTIHRVGADSSGPIDSLPTDGRGRYRFDYRRTGNPDAIYFVAAVYRGIAYFSAPLRAAVVKDDDAEIVVFDTTTARVPLTVQGHHLVIGAPRPTGLRDIVEVYEISNDTVVTSIGRDTLTAVWSAPLPRGIIGFAAGSGDVSASALQQRGEQVVLLAPFAPGVKQISFTYALDANAFPLEVELDRPNALLEVLLEEAGAQVRSPSLRSQGTATTKGRTFKRFLAQNAPAGETVRIDVPSSAAAARSVVVTALTVVVTLAMIVALWVAYRRGARPRPAVAVADGVGALAAAIAALDARHEANDPSLTPSAYESQRTALKTRLAAALAAVAHAE